MHIKPGFDKILKGVLKYNKSVKGELVPFFREILDKPAPKSVLISCVDSRIVASRLLQAEPGGYFLIRTPGNFVPKFESLEKSAASGIPAAFELACVINKVNTICVIGNSDSKPLDILYNNRNNIENLNNTSALNNWVYLNGKDTVAKFKEFEKSGFKKPLSFSETNNKFEAYIDPENQYDARDKFSMINTLEQLKNINNYSFLKDKIKDNSVKEFALWVDVFKSDVYFFSFNEKRFIKIDDDSYEKLYKECLSIQPK